MSKQYQKQKAKWKEQGKQEERERVLGLFEKEFQYAEPLTKLLIDNTIKKIRKGQKEK